MPRSRGSELPQRSPKFVDRRGATQQKTSNSDSESLHHRSNADKSNKLGDGRSPRGSQSDPVNQRKLGTRIAGLESQLEQAQEELKNLKDQLASAEAAKKQVQQELEEKDTKPIMPEAEELDKKDLPPSETQDYNKTGATPPANADGDQQETDVFEVPVEKVSMEPGAEISQPTGESELSVKLQDFSTRSTVTSEPEKPMVDELALKIVEMSLMKAKMEEKQKELNFFSQENAKLKIQLNEATSEISSAQTKEKETQLRLNQLGEELETSKGKIFHINEKLESVEAEKEALETEMKKLRVQTEQWRKAADAAASVLAGGIGMSGRRLSERCGSMDKHYGSTFQPPMGGYTDFVGSPGLGDDSDDGFGSGKRKGSGIRMFGDLWRKKSLK